MNTDQDQQRIREYLWRRLRSASCKWQQCDIAGLLNCRRQASLMWRANTGQAARHNLATLGDKLREQPVILVIDGLNLLHAKLANLLAPEIFAATFAAPGPSRAASTRWTPLAAVSALGSLSAAFSAG